MDESWIKKAEFILRGLKTKYPSDVYPIARKWLPYIPLDQLESRLSTYLKEHPKLMDDRYGE